MAENVISLVVGDEIEIESFGGHKVPQAEVISLIVGEEIEIESFGAEIPQVDLISLGPTGDVTPEAIAARDAAQAFAEQADQSAIDAATSATAAEAAQLAAEGFRDQSDVSALASANSAQNSEDSAAAAQASALAAANSALEASDLESATSDLRDETEIFRNESLVARNAAQAAETGAVTARTAAEAAKIDAENAQAASETARDTSMQKAQETVVSAADALASENAAAASAADALASQQAALVSENAAAASANAAAADRQDVLIAKGQVDVAKAAVDTAKAATDQARDDAIGARDASQSARDIALQAQSDAETANAAAQQAKLDTQAIVDAVDGTLFDDYMRKDANGADFADPDEARENIRAHHKMPLTTMEDAANGASMEETSWTAALVREAIIAYAAAIVHQHGINQITGLQSALDARSLVGHRHGMAEIDDLLDTVALLASKDSPALTGTPTAPTAALGTNTNQIATMAALQAAIANLINGAPGALDTIREIAEALGNDPNFAATILNQLAGKAPIIHRHPTSDVDGLDDALAEALKKPTFYGFNLSPDGHLLMTTDQTSDFKVKDFATWAVMTRVSFSIVNNALVMHL